MVTIKVDFDKKCAECGKGGAVPSGLCLRCTTKAMQGKPMRTKIGQLVQRRARETLDLARRR